MGSAHPGTEHEHDIRNREVIMPDLPTSDAGSQRTIADRVGDSRIAVQLVPFYDRLAGLVEAWPPSEALRGQWLGHAVHPVLSDLPLGCWTSATVLDLIGFKRSRPAATTLVAVGLLTAGPTDVSGLAEFGGTHGQDRRIAAVHGAGNAVGVVLYAASLRARLRGRHLHGVLAALAGSAVTAGAGHLGGELALNRGLGARRPVVEDRAV
jgi:uncharacterized membrane protein